MDTNIIILSVFSSSIVAGIIVFPIINNWALKTGHTDKPSERKVHKQPTPLSGGLAIGLNILIIMGIFSFTLEFSTEIIAILLMSYLLLVMGFIDDHYDLSAKIKLLVQVVSAIILIFCGVAIQSLYGLFGIDELNRTMSFFLTVFVVTGVVNAINLMDGIDGLLGGLALLAFTAVAISAIMLKDFTLGYLHVALAGSAAVHLRFNLRKRGKIFLGDAGSLFFGFIISSSCIYLLGVAEESLVIDPETILGIILSLFLIPVIDSLRVYFARWRKGNSPFEADKTHLHHLLLNIGFTHIESAFLIHLATLILIITAVFLSVFMNVTMLLLTMVILFYLPFTVLKIALNLKHFDLQKRFKG